MKVERGGVGDINTIPSRPDIRTEGGEEKGVSNYDMVSRVRNIIQLHHMEYNESFRIPKSSFPNEGPCRTATPGF